MAVGLIAIVHGSGFPIGCRIGISSFLGTLGGRVADVPRAAARARSSDCPQHVRSASWVFGEFAGSIACWIIVGSWDVQVEPGEWPHGLPLLNSTEVLSRCPTAPEFALQPIIPYSRVGNGAH